MSVRVVFERAPTVFRGGSAGQPALVMISTGPTPELGLDLLGIEAGSVGAAPALNLRIGLRRADGGTVQCVLLTAAATLAASRRGYDEAARDAHAEADGAAEAGPEAPDTAPPGGLPWARVGATVPTFRGGTEVVLTLPCGRDLLAAALRLPRDPRGGAVPLALAFDGTAFLPGESGAPRTRQVPWRHEATGLLAVRPWRELADRTPGAARWLRLDGDCFGRLAAYRARRAHPSFDDTVDELLHSADALRGGESTA